MKLTENQKKFLNEQIRLWTGHHTNAEIPPEYARLLLGTSEAKLPFHDHQGNKDFQYNPLFWAGQVFDPVINKWLKKVTNPQKENALMPLWPEKKEFAVCLSHDVDMVNLYSSHSALWNIRNSSRLTDTYKAKIKLQAVNFGKLLYLESHRRLRPKQSSFIKPWLDLEESYGFRSTFFFFPDTASRYHRLDGRWYRHQDRIAFGGQWLSVAELMRYLESRGWEVGLHGTIESYIDCSELQRQKETVEKSLGAEIVSTRQHHLHFDITQTPKAQSQAGFKFDSTFGFNRLIGFRNGLALPFHFFDLHNDEPLPILEIPLHIQDGALLFSKNLGLPPQLTLSHAQTMIDKVAEHNGLITLLWHPDSYGFDQYRSWFAVYEALLEYIAGKGAWVTTVRDIGFWWKKRQKALLNNKSC